MLKILRLLIFGFVDRVLNIDHMASMGVEGVDLLFYSMTWDWKAMKVGEMGARGFWFVYRFERIDL